jgi:hypothetical protein
MAFKINLTDPYQEELDSVEGGFRTEASSKKVLKKPKKLSSASRYDKDLLKALMTIGGFNKGGAVLKSRRKKTKHF